MSRKCTTRLYEFYTGFCTTKDCSPEASLVAIDSVTCVVTVLRLCPGPDWYVVVRCLAGSDERLIYDTKA